MRVAATADRPVRTAHSARYLFVRCGRRPPELLRTIRDVSIDAPKLRMIEHVEIFRPELQL